MRELLGKIEAEVAVGRGRSAQMIRKYVKRVYAVEIATARIHIVTAIIVKSAGCKSSKRVPFIEQLTITLALVSALTRPHGLASLSELPMT
jgi:hypothetical protein